MELIPCATVLHFVSESPVRQSVSLAHTFVRLGWHGELKLLACRVPCEVRCSIPAKREWSTSLDENLSTWGGALSSFAAEIVLWTIRGTPHSHLPLKCERPWLYLLILLAPYRSRTPVFPAVESRSDPLAPASALPLGPHRTTLLVPITRSVQTLSGRLLPTTPPTASVN